MYDSGALARGLSTHLGVRAGVKVIEKTVFRFHLHATVQCTKNTVNQAGKHLSVHDDKFRYDEREIDATKKLT